MYGRFYSGDSYVVLYSWKTESGALAHAIHFWLGAKTSIDEMGTAAYKTVELDDLLDGVPTQHREVMNNESEQFLRLFRDHVEYMEGGIDSAFTHVTPETYQKKLLQVRRTRMRGIHIKERPVTIDSLNQGDCFLLDLGTKIYIWMGDDSSPFEKQACAVAAENLENKRCGKSESTNDIDDAFWEALGGPGEIKSAGCVDDSITADTPKESAFGEGVLYKLSDSSGELLCTEVARGDLRKDMLSSEDVMMVDTDREVMLWIGTQASSAESKNALRTAMRYLTTNEKPKSTPIHVFKEGCPILNKMWNKMFAN
jgi:gelsolin